MYMERQPRGMCLLVDDLTVSENSLYFRHDAGPRLSTLVSRLLMQSSQFAFLKLRHHWKGCLIGVMIGLMVTPFCRCCECVMALYIVQLHMSLIFSDTKARSRL